MRLGYGITTPLNGFSKSNNTTLNKVGAVTLAGFFSDYLRKVIGLRRELLAKILSFILLSFYLPISNVKFVIRARKEKIPVKLRLIFSTNNHFTYLTYIGINLLKVLAYNCNDMNLSFLEECFLKKYLSSSYVKSLEKNVNSFAKMTVIARLLTRLLRLADASFHRKAF
jgi:hypothetical protein